MKKIELEIVALSHSITQTHSYAVVLGEVNGLRRLPIVIGGFEAQAIAVALEKMQPSRPLTHDLMKNFMKVDCKGIHEILHQIMCKWAAWLHFLQCYGNRLGFKAAYNNG